MYYEYRVKSYLNASHFIIINQEKGQIHPHCFELSITIRSIRQRTFISFMDLEQMAEAIIAPYQGQLINQIFPFTEIVPTLENLCEYFKDRIVKELSKIDCVLVMIELSETPARSCIMEVTGRGNDLRLPYEDGDLEFIQL